MGGRGLGESRGSGAKLGRQPERLERTPQGEFTTMVLPLESE